MRPALLAAALAVAGCAHQPRGLAVVEAQGWAPVDPADPPAAQRRALADAQRRAVEQARGVSVWGRTTVAQGRTVEQRLSAASGGVIARYKILETSVEEGFIKARIRAWVAPEASDRARLPRPPPPGDPKIVVLLRGDERLSEPAARGVRRGLSELGFSFAGPAEKARMTVTGSARAAELLGGYGFRSCRAKISLQALGESGQPLSDASEEASAVDPLREAARDKALEQAGFKAGHRLGLELLALLAWR